MISANNYLKKLPKFFLALAPMAGYTDQPFRLMCKKYGADLLYSEMISSEAIWHSQINSKLQKTNNKQIINSNNQSIKQLRKTLELIEFSQAERPYVVQIFGADPEHLAFAAEYIAIGEWGRDYAIIKSEMRNSKSETNHNVQNLNNQNSFVFRASDFVFTSIPSGIDVNMGCPVRDVVKTGAGAALIKNQENAIKIIKAIKKRVQNIPVSVKTRLGWDRHDEILEFSKKLQDAGIDAIAIHGRTYKEGFSGPVDWEMIGKVKRQLSIPVIGNGGIDNNFQFPISNFQLRLDGYMIGTGALGQPWIFEKIKNQFANWRTKIKIDEKFVFDNIQSHAKLVDELKGEQGFKEFRKHFAWYLKALPDTKKYRQKINQINSLKDVEKILKLA